MPPSRKPNIPQNYWSLEKAKREGAQSKDFDQSVPKLPPSHKQEKLRDGQGKYKGTTK